MKRIKCQTEKRKGHGKSRRAATSSPLARDKPVILSAKVSVHFVLFSFSRLLPFGRSRRAVS
jgi:hypothetical protein